MTKILHICAREWRDSYGNTYHSRRVTLNGEPLVEANTDFEYGHGEAHHIYAAQAAGRVAGVLPPLETYDNGGTEPVYQWRDRNGIRLTVDRVTVTRKRDLHP